jgi:hypothetical protein
MKIDRKIDICFAIYPQKTGFFSSPAIREKLSSETNLFFRAVKSAIGVPRQFRCSARETYPSCHFKTKEPFKMNEIRWPAGRATGQKKRGARQ